jgi:hypothetical protein
MPGGSAGDEASKQLRNRLLELKEKEDLKARELNEAQEAFRRKNREVVKLRSERPPHKESKWVSKFRGMREAWESEVAVEREREAREKRVEEEKNARSYAASVLVSVSDANHESKRVIPSVLPEFWNPAYGQRHSYCEKCKLPGQPGRIYECAYCPVVCHTGCVEMPMTTVGTALGLTPCHSAFEVFNSKLETAVHSGHGERGGSDERDTRFENIKYLDGDPVQEELEKRARVCPDFFERMWVCGFCEVDVFSNVGDENENAFRRKMHRKENVAAIKLQSCVRRRKARDEHTQLIAGIIKVQSHTPPTHAHTSHTRTHLPHAHAHSLTPLIHSSHTLLSHTPLIHFSHSHIHLSHTPLTHTSHTSLSLTHKVQSSFRGVVARAFVNSIFGLDKRAFKIKVHYARHLSASDLHSDGTGTSDPFVNVAIVASGTDSSHAKHLFRFETAIIHKQLNPAFNETFLVPGADGRVKLVFTGQCGNFIGSTVDPCRTG